MDNKHSLSCLSNEVRYSDDTINHCSSVIFDTRARFQMSRTCGMTNFLCMVLVVSFQDRVPVAQTIISEHIIFVCHGIAPQSFLCTYSLWVVYSALSSFIVARLIEPNYFPIKSVNCLASTVFILLLMAETSWSVSQCQRLYQKHGHKSSDLQCELKFFKNLAG